MIQLFTGYFIPPRGITHREIGCLLSLLPLGIAAYIQIHVFKSHDKQYITEAQPSLSNHGAMLIEIL